MSPYPTLMAGLLTAAQAVVDRALAYDPGSRQRLRALAGQTLAIEIRQPATTVYLHLTEAGPQLRQHAEGDITSTLSGSATDLARLLLNPGKSLHDTGVTLTGSTALLEQLQTILQELDIDWEEALADRLGIMPAHALAETGRRTGAWTRDRAEQLERLMREYLTEESHLVVGRAEFDAFSEEVHELRLALDRAQARWSAINRADSPADKES